MNGSVGSRGAWSKLVEAVKMFRDDCGCDEGQSKSVGSVAVDGLVTYLQGIGLQRSVVIARKAFRVRFFCNFR